jgi:hypothetical protein
MSEKERQKKDGRDKNKKNQARREPTPQSSSAKTEKEKPARFREGLPRNDQSETKQ